MNEYGTSLALGTFKMPSLRLVCDEKSQREKKHFESNLEQRIAKAGIVRLNADISETMAPDNIEMIDPFVEEGTQETLMSPEELKQLKNDNTDFYELRFELNEDANVPPKLQSLPSDPDAAGIAWW